MSPDTRVNVPPVETPRLTLRLPQMLDAGPMLEIHQDPAVVKYLLLANAQGGLTAAWRSVAMMVGHWHLRGYGQWTVVDRANGGVVGRVGLWYPEGWPGVELGWIIRRERWGEGLATEAAAAALDWAWDQVDTDHIISIIQPDNLRSIRVAEKIGESFERTELVTGVPSSVYGIYRPASRPRR
jgi:RimJ/RimL family protein N-acetyltransferase